TDHATVETTLRDDLRDEGAEAPDDGVCLYGQDGTKPGQRLDEILQRRWIHARDDEHRTIDAGSREDLSRGDGFGRAVPQGENSQVAPVADPLGAAQRRP